MRPAGRSFGVTWWGRAWLDALENSGTDFGARLRAGRSAARRGQVQDLTVDPGHVAARVVDRTGEILRVDLAVRPLAPAEQEQVAEAIAAKAAHLAALLDGELLPAVVEDAREVDVELLPRPSDLRPDCECPDMAEPCRHAAAVCYVVADALDADPFLIFVLRGVSRDDLLDAVRKARTGGEPEGTGQGGSGTEPAAADLPGVDAAWAWEGSTLDDELPTLPDAARPRTSARGGPPLSIAAWTPDLPPRAGVDTDALDELALDAARRAWFMLVDGADSHLRLDRRADLARRATDDPAGRVALAAAAGVTPAQLRVWADAWNAGGQHAVTVVADHRSWSTDQDALSAGRDLLVEAGMTKRSIALSFDSLGLADGVWFVIGPDDRWYPLTGPERHAQLELLGPPSEDVRDLLALI